LPIGVASELTSGRSGSHSTLERGYRGGLPMKQLALIVAAVLTGTTVALAESEEGRQACMQDAFKFCSDFIPDRERVFQCMASHQDVISAACRANMAPALAAEQAAKEQHASETKSTVHKPKATKHLAAEQPASKKHATRHANGKVASAEHASLPADHPHLKKHAHNTSQAKAKATSTAVARRDGKPLNLLPR
jgi:hypothetical protein